MLIAYIIIMNIIGFILMGIDKYKAQKHKWRLPERLLFTISVLGGSLGTWGGMYFFRHKTKHICFIIGMPLILVLQIILYHILSL